MKSRTLTLSMLLCGVLAYSVWVHNATPTSGGMIDTIDGSNGRKSAVLLSVTYQTDRIHQSMQGPYSTHRDVALGDGESPELIWVTGLDTAVVDEGGSRKISEEFFCHANLTLDEERSGPDVHNQLFNDTTSLGSRLFKLVPGRMQISLPEGSGVPVLSTENLNLFSMWLNQNLENPNVNIRFRSNVDYIEDKNADHAMKAVFLRSI